MRRRARIVQVVSDLAKKPVADLRILDLASLEGHYSFEFAASGAQVTGIEGRQSNIDKAEALGEKLHLAVKFIRDDVRNLSVEKHGTFDVVLCLGILYHLDAADISPFLKSVNEVCGDFAVIDTHVALKPHKRFGKYSGWYFTEYVRKPSPVEQESSSWASIGNMRSFWPTRPSLVNALADAGFSSVTEVHYPAMNDMPADRVTVVAFKGQRRQPVVEFSDSSILGEAVPETPPVAATQERSTSQLRSILSRLARSISSKR